MSTVKIPSFMSTEQANNLISLEKMLVKEEKEFIQKHTKYFQIYNISMLFYIHGIFYAMLFNYTDEEYTMVVVYAILVVVMIPLYIKNLLKKDKIDSPLFAILIAIFTSVFMALMAFNFYMDVIV